MLPKLYDRFVTFCRSYPGAEEIDAIPLTPEQKASKLKKADFFFENRTIICEIKTLEENTSKKLVKVMKENGLDPADLESGRHIVEELFLKLPKGKNLYNQVIKSITKPIEKGFDDAALQIRDTKKLFNILSADGLLVILNEDVAIVGQTLIAERLGLRLKKKNEEGQPYHQDVTWILHIGETNAVETASGDKRVNTTYPNPLATEAHGVEEFVYKLMATSKLFVNVGEGTSGHKTPRFEGS